MRGCYHRERGGEPADRGTKGPTIYPIRLLLCVAWFFIGSVLLSALSLIPHYRFQISYIYGKFLGPIALWILGIDFVIRHPERLNGAVPSILVPNHQHMFDMFVIGSILPPRTITVGKSSIRWIPVFGWLFSWTGNLYIQRSVSEKAMATMQAAHQRIKEQGLSVVIAPEGTRSGKRGLLPFKKGAFHLAVNTGLPLQPIAISTFHTALNHWRWRAGRVILEALDPIPTTGLTRADIPALMDMTHARIKAGIAALDAELAGAPA